VVIYGLDGRRSEEDNHLAVGQADHFGRDEGAQDIVKEAF
jgi:hypothetical protein